MKALQLNGQPFTSLRICYFKVYEQPQEKIFLDATDEQILLFITKHFHETAHIIKIETVEVLEVITTIPKKRKLTTEELKSGITEAERQTIADKVAKLREKYK